MTSNKTLIATIDDLENTKYIKKQTKTLVNNGLELVKEHATSEETKCINKVIKIVNKPKYYAADKKILIQIKSSVIDVVKKYEEEYNEEENDDIINPNLTVDQIEKLLDDKIPCYHFNDRHPMKTVTFDATHNRWRFKNDSIDRNSNNKTKIIDMAKNYLFPDLEYDPNKTYTKKYFAYQDHYLVSYWTNNEPYFDIQHTISVLNLKTASSNLKYNEYCKKIVFRFWHKNIYDGYILRELIDEKTMYDLILSSNSDLSKSFKKDISEIQADLRKENKIQITNKKIKKTSANSNNKHCNLVQNKKFCFYSYNIPEHVTFVQDMIHQGCQISIGKFSNKHVLYAFIITLKTDHNYVIIKFGYTYKLHKRFKSLQSEYKSNVHFINAKIITAESDEIKFHKILKTKYPHLIEEYSIDGKDKTELYKFNPVLIKEFNEYLNTDEINPASVENKKNESSVQKQIDHYESMIKEKDLKLAKIKYQNLEKEIELAELKSKTLQEEIDTIRLITEPIKSNKQMKKVNTKK